MNVNQTSALNIKKILILGFIMSIIGLVVVMRIFELSFPNSYEQVTNKKQSINNINHERGLLLDRNENVIASNIYVYSLKAYPRKINKPENDNLTYRVSMRKKYKGIGEINLDKYMPHLNFGYNEFARKEIALYLEQKTNDIYDATYKKAKGAGLSEKESGKKAAKAAKEFVRANENKLIQAGEFFSYSELVEPAILTEADLKSSVSEQGSLANVLKARDANAPGFDKRPEVILDYINKVIRGYYKNAVAIKGQYEIDNMLNKNKNYKPSEKETKRLQGSVYKNDVQVWGDYIKLYLQSILGHQSYFQSGMLSGRDPLKLKDKRN